MAEGEESGTLSGGIWGGGAQRPGKANLRLIRQAIRAGWLDDVPQQQRDAIIRHLVAVEMAGHTRNTLAASRCILEADKANMRGS
jgi:hypothetical protein